MSERLTIIAQSPPDFRQYLRQGFSGVESVGVLRDRRRGERRQRVHAYEPERRRADRRHRPSPEGYRMNPWLLRAPRSGVEIVRHLEEPVEIKLSGLVGALERRARRWRAAALLMLVGLAVGASVAVAVLALRWDYQRGRTLQLLRNDLEVTQARARCWEALARYLPKSPEDVIPDVRRSEWVRQCLATELARLNPK